MANRAETTITLTDAPDDDERTVITDGLRAYNERRREVRTDVRSPSSSAILKQRWSAAAYWAARTSAS